MSGWTQTIVVGNLGKDPELKYMQNGRAVCNFTMAVSESWTDKNTQERKDRTTWFRVAVWGPQAETCSKFLAKGRQVMVIGRVTASAYKAQDGNPQATLELTATDVRFLGGRDDGNQPQGSYESSGGGSSNDSGPAETDSDIPF
jgi:single-strand DNA-binding protein